MLMLNYMNDQDGDNLALGEVMPLEVYASATAAAAVATTTINDDSSNSCLHEYSSKCNDLSNSGMPGGCSLRNNVFDNSNSGSPGCSTNCNDAEVLAADCCERVPAAFGSTTTIVSSLYIPPSQSSNSGFRRAVPVVQCALVGRPFRTDGSAAACCKFVMFAAFGSATKFEGFKASSKDASSSKFLQRMKVFLVSS